MVNNDNYFVQIITTEQSLQFYSDFFQTEGQLEFAFPDWLLQCNEHQVIQFKLNSAARYEAELA